VTDTQTKKKPNTKKHTKQRKNAGHVFLLTERGMT